RQDLIISHALPFGKPLFLASGLPAPAFTPSLDLPAPSPKRLARRACRKSPAASRRPAARPTARTLNPAPVGPARCPCATASLPSLEPHDKGLRMSKL